MLVIFSHAYVIATGVEEAEPLVRLLGPGHILGLYSVFTFFIISGFLLSRSLSSSPSAVTFVVNRTLRILPAFALCTVVTAFVIGPAFSAVGARQYFSSALPFDFVHLSLATFERTTLSGLFNYPGNPDLAEVVNGSLWSLRYEALSYVFLLVSWAIAPSIGFRACTTGLTALVVWLFPRPYLLTGIAYTLPYFAAGVVMHWIHSRYGTRAAGAWWAAALLVAACVLGVQHDAFAPLGAYLVIFLGERSNLGSRLAAKMGDCSYGLYLYGWPAEQMVKQVTHTTSPFVLFALALPLALGFALVSYHFIEAPAMRLRWVAAARLKGGLAWMLAQAGAGRGVAVVAARASFVAATVAILCSGRWWDFALSMFEIMLCTLVGSVLAVACYQLGASFRDRLQAAHG